MTQDELLELVKKAKTKFSNSGSTKVTRGTVLFIQGLICDLYVKRSTAKVSKDSFIGNLPSSGKKEGAYDDIVGTVEDAIERISENYLDGAYASNVEILMRNIENMLSKERYKSSDINNICNKTSQKLGEISTGIY